MNKLINLLITVILFIIMCDFAHAQDNVSREMNEQVSKLLLGASSKLRAVLGDRITENQNASIKYPYNIDFKNMLIKDGYILNDVLDLYYTVNDSFESRLLEYKNIQNNSSLSVKIIAANNQTNAVNGILSILGTSTNMMMQKDMFYITSGIIGDMCIAFNENVVADKNIIDSVFIVRANIGINITSNDKMNLFPLAKTICDKIDKSETNDLLFNYINLKISNAKLTDKVQNAISGSEFKRLLTKNNILMSEQFHTMQFYPGLFKVMKCNVESGDKNKYDMLYAIASDRNGIKEIIYSLVAASGDVDVNGLICLEKEHGNICLYEKDSSTFEGGAMVIKRRAWVIMDEVIYQISCNNAGGVIPIIDKINKCLISRNK
jgi:hypothetical protein